MITAGLVFCCEPVNIVCACVPAIRRYHWEVRIRRVQRDLNCTSLWIGGEAEQNKGVCGTGHGVHLRGLSKARRRIDNRSVAADEVSTAWDCG